MRHYSQRLAQGILLFLGITLVISTGCGQITDKDRIRVAKIGDRYITRGELFKIIREMPDRDRPMIRNKSDLLRVLNDQIDRRIKLPLGKQLASEGKISVDREFAREQYFLNSGDQEDQLRTMWRMEVPPSGEITPMMSMFGLTPELLQFNKDSIEEETDRMVANLQADMAVEYLAAEAVKEGTITIDENEIQRDYEFMKNELITLEKMNFIAISFAADDPAAAAKAAALREQIDRGVSFDDLVRDYEAKGKEEGRSYLIQSNIENNPNSEKFRGFWAAASEAEISSIIGPVFLPAYSQVSLGDDGQRNVVDRPAAYIVLKVIDHSPEAVLSYENAKPLVIRPLLISKMMHLLRDERGVEIYNNKLPDPALNQGPAASI
ncbi:MAG: hypothetical protein WCX86_07785 [Candidatus Hydrogenedentales bacterium]